MKNFPQLSAKVDSVFNRIVDKPYLRLFTFSAITFCILLVMNQSWVSTSAGFMPSFKTFLFYFLFYMFGWLLFRSKHLLGTFMKYDFLSTVLGILLLSVSLLYQDNLSIEFIMALNINNLNGSNQVKQKIEQQNQVKQQAVQQSGAEQTKAVRQDSVSLTPQAKQMSELQKKAADAPVVDQKKIEQLKKAIASGEYKIDPEKLAANIANFEFNID